MIDAKCKICRRAGEKLFLKGEKCFTPSCTFEKKPYAPGKGGPNARRKRGGSEFGRQLLEKQKVRNTYRVSEKQFSTYVKSAAQKKNVNPKEYLYESLESRLDNVVFRLGLSGVSRALARQLVAHGHITVNGRRVSAPSHQVRKGDVVSIREGSRKKPVFVDVAEKSKDKSVPAWLLFDHAKMQGSVQGQPAFGQEELVFDFGSVIEFYSR